ncbi:hypothetical protein [Erythrobacter sp. R86502]|uniref:hypothetical protein n=1 Tax=Erythrobacter sp. R86502 TaxID=3093846 RepID=UPI0036D3C920
MDTFDFPPVVTCALSIVRDCTELAPASRAVAASAFVVTDDEKSTTFDVRTAVVLPALSRQAAIEHIAAMIPPGARVIMRAPRLPRGLVRHLSRGWPMPVHTDAQVLAAIRPDANVRSVTVPEEAMAAVARQYGIRRAGRGDTTAEQARCCDAEAQALYLVHHFSSPNMHERTRLAAAYQAWVALQRARPLGAFGPSEIF